MKNEVGILDQLGYLFIYEFFTCNFFVDHQNHHYKVIPEKFMK